LDEDSTEVAFAANDFNDYEVDIFTCVNSDIDIYGEVSLRGDTIIFLY
jgi:hypothetical protein